MSDVDKRLGILEMKSKDHERRIRIQEEKVDSLREISATLRELSKQNERNEKRFEQITAVLDGMNTSLLSLNHDVKSLKEKQEAMDNKVGELEQERLNELKEVKQEKRRFIISVVTGVAVTVIGALMLVWLGLK